MATWDGSYNSEDSNYFVYANQNVAGSNEENWAYYSRNDSNAYGSNVTNVYSQSEPMMFERNALGGFYQVSSEANAIPQVPSNLVSLGNTYQLLPNNVRPTNVQNNVRCLQEGNSSLSASPYLYCQNSNYGVQNNAANNVGSNLENNRHALKTDIAKHSNLHATANEFVPNGVKRKEERNTFRNEYSGSSESMYNAHYEEHKLNVPVSDNRNKCNRKYDKKNTNYKQRETQDNRSQKPTVYKNSQRMQNPRNHSRFQNNRYFNRNEIATTSSNPNNVQEDYDVGSSQENVGSRSFKSNIKPRRKATQHNPGEGSSMDSNNAQTEEKYKKTDGYYNDSNYRRRNLKSEQTNTSSRNMKRYENTYKERRNDYQSYNDFKENSDKQNNTEKLKDKDMNLAEGHKEKDSGNWRKPESSSQRINGGQKRWQNKRQEYDDDVSQRERLADQLNRGQLECLVCCEYIKQNDYIWSCSNCYHVLHLKCVKKWAKSSQVENGWRCPACQNVNSTIPEEYYCFCGKVRAPEWNRRDIAHSCGEVCGRTRSKNNCVHKCTLLCHPGSCPQCTAMVTKYCGCGRTSQVLQCGVMMLLKCDTKCGKELNCKIHTCEKECHHGECGPCDTILVQECYCGKNTREVTCTFDTVLTYACGSVCEKLLECKNHKCKKICHEEPCEPCALTPDKVTTCCCGQTPLEEKRESCLDPVSTCDKMCSKRLKCGQPSNPHTCKAKCHEGECPPCELTTDVKCRCGNMDKEIACKDLTTKADDARCETRCTKKRSCGRHKCNQLCCIDIEHICPLPCSKTLSCGRHKCEQTCHKGRCQPCWHSSFEELYCECGTAVIYPPVPCGTRRPTCTRPCSREHPCGHEVLHNCHSEATCPPCTVLTQKWCHGKHELRKAVPCYVEELSCGLPCNKPISCGRHKCIMTCHSGPCEKPGQLCVQPCTNPRELCEHICAAPCHEGKCPDTPCKETVKVTCQCGHRSTTRACAENSKEYQRIASSILASKMADMQLGHSVDLEEVFGQGAKKQNQLKTLECNDECKLIERNRRLALGLQIVNPDLSGKLMPRYSDYMKQWAKKDPHFCQTVHEKLTELVQLAKTSKQKSRSYSFECMNREKRHFVHESCEHFGCESQAYDQEPKRNIVATAVKDKCWLPSYSLLEIVQRENGQRKVPGPMVKSASKDSTSTKTVLSALPVRKKSVLQSTRSRSPEPGIDYFDYHGFDIK